MNHVPLAVQHVGLSHLLVRCNRLGLVPDSTRLLLRLHVYAALRQPADSQQLSVKSMDVQHIEHLDAHAVYAREAHRPSPYHADLLTVRDGHLDLLLEILVLKQVVAVRRHVRRRTAVDQPPSRPTLSNVEDRVIVVTRVRVRAVPLRVAHLAATFP